VSTAEPQRDSESDAVFGALADPTRRQILRLLGEREGATAGEIASEFPEVTRTAVSAHLRVLRTARLVFERRQGKYRVYSLGPGHADEVVGFLAEVYRDSLSQLKEAVERGGE
jgi:ArsR family transcriptional regulator, arsenate/arsenite/antimonite-responsive transcriptional repressor